MNLTSQRIEFQKEQNLKKVWVYIEIKQLKKVKEPKQKEKEEAKGLAKLEGLATDLKELVKDEEDDSCLFKLHVNKWHKSERLNDKFQL